MLPSNPRAMAITSTCSCGRNLAGSMNPRKGGEVSTSRRCHAVAPTRRKANATLTGALPDTVAAAATRLLRSSGRTTSLGLVGAPAKTEPSAFNSVMPTPPTITSSLPVADEVERGIPAGTSVVHVPAGEGWTFYLHPGRPVVEDGRVSLP